VVAVVAVIATGATGCVGSAFVSGFAAGFGNSAGSMIMDMISLEFLTRIAENALDDLGGQLVDTLEPLLPEEDPDDGEPPAGGEVEL
jgi:hypothetical protein